VANARIRDIREEAVDDAVVAAMNTAPEFYASTLLEVAAHAFDKPLASLGLLGIMESQSGLRHRIQRLVTSRRPRIVGLTLLSLLLIIGIGALLIPLGSGPFDYPPSVGNPNPVTQLQPATPIQNNGTKSNGGANPIPAVAVDTNSMRSSSGVQIQVEAKFYEVSLSNLTPGDTNNPFLQVIGKTEADRSVSSETRTLLELPQTMRADLVSSQPRSCVLTDQQFRTWIRWVELGSGNDILSAPPFSFVEGQTGKFQLLEDIAIATGIDTNAVKKHIEGSNSNLYTTETIKGGPHIIMRANTTENHDISLFVAAHIVEFKGFGTPTKADQIILKSDAGESMRLTNPKPYCRVIEMSAQGALTNGQTLLVGGPTNMSTRVTKDKVPVLGDVPIIGRLFRSEQTNHNTTQMFITLTAVVKDGGNATAAEKH
jgi:type II secretory pathway component GspD/PulD (secretin)